MAKKGNQNIARETVRLVEEHDERLARLAAEAAKSSANSDCAFVGINSRRCLTGDTSLGFECSAIVVEQQISDCMAGLAGILRVLERLERAVQRDHIALRVDLAREGLDRRGLAGLARRMDDEIAPKGNKPPNLRQPVKRRKHIVFNRNARPRRVEVLFHVAHYTIISAMATCRRMRAPRGATRRIRGCRRGCCGSRASRRRACPGIQNRLHQEALWSLFPDPLFICLLRKP